MAEEGVIRLLHLDPTLFGDTPPLTPEEFSSPLLGKFTAPCGTSAATAAACRR